MPVDARRLIRKMRGGAQAHLLEAADGHSYVVKFANNPQHRRILVNEWLAASFLEYLGLSSPKVAMVRVTREFLKENPEAYLQFDKSRVEVEEGWHFGSRYPGDPLRTAVYDYLPDSLLGQVENQDEFRGILAFDKWVGNADSRQAIFFRAKVKDYLGDPGPRRQRLGFVAQMMDNGYVFEGPHWRLSDAPLHGLYFRPQVYREVRGLGDFEPWLDRIQHFPEEVMDCALKQIPEEWLEQQGSGTGERAELEALLERLLRRRKRVGDLIEACRAGRTEVFPNWRVSSVA